MGGSSGSKLKDDDKSTTDSSTKLKETSSGFHFLEIHMPSMGTERGLLLLVLEAAVVLRWWFKRKKAKQAWSQGLFEERSGSPAAAAAKRVPHDAVLLPLLDGH